MKECIPRDYQNYRDLYKIRDNANWVLNEKRNLYLYALIRGNWSIANDVKRTGTEHTARKRS